MYITPKHILIIILFLAPTLLLAQKTRQVRNRSTHETYHVLRSDRDIKHGQYQKRNLRGRLEVSGHYKLGVRDSVWMYFDPMGSGLAFVYCYTRKEVVYRNPIFAEFNSFEWSEDGNRVEFTYRIVTGDTVTVPREELDVPPQFPGGEEARRQYIRDNLRYPRRARDNGIQGTVFISFIVERDGSITNVRLARGIGGGCDEEAFRVVIEMPNWSPGMVDGEPVRTRFMKPIRFTLGGFR